MSEPDVDLRIDGARFLMIALSSQGLARLEKLVPQPERIGDAFSFSAQRGPEVVQLLLEAGLRVRRIVDSPPA